MNQELCDCPSFQTKYYISFNENSGGGQAVNKNGGSNIFCVISKNQKWSWHSNGEKVKKTYSK